MSLKKVLLFVLSIAVATTFSFVNPALAAGDAAKGAQLFNANCTACHAGGRNLVIAQKNLSQDALKQYLTGYNDDEIAAITYQVTNGKGAMPAFGGRLNADQINDIATYVNGQSKQGW